MYGNPKSLEMGWHEVARPQRYRGRLPRAVVDRTGSPTAHFMEAINNSTFDLNGKKRPTVSLPRTTLQRRRHALETLLTAAPLPSPTCAPTGAPRRSSGRRPGGVAANGFLHLITCAVALDAPPASEGRDCSTPHEAVVRRHKETISRRCSMRPDWCRAN